MNTVLIAGATGYLGRHLCAEYKRRGWCVHALVRDESKAQDVMADRMIQAEATWPETLTATMTGADLVISALGITRQTDGLGYWDVDYQANLNLLTEAMQAGVKRFAYVHVLNADLMPDVPLVAAKSAFIGALEAADIASTIISPSGYFSDMADFLTMARSGRVWLFGDGLRRINPIHGADLATATADAIAQERAWLDVGGPDTFTHNGLARLAFDILGKPAKITHLPDGLRYFAAFVLRWLTPRRISGPARFFLAAMGADMQGAPRGTHHLAEHFAQLEAEHRRTRSSSFAIEGAKP